MIQLKQQVVPIEVKAGKNHRIKSMQLFLDSHPHSTYAIRFWALNESYDKKIYSYPLYAVCKPLLENNNVMRDALMALF